MGAPQAPTGWSLAYDRVSFDKVTAQVMNLLAELDDYWKNGSSLSHAKPK